MIKVTPKLFTIGKYEWTEDEVKLLKKFLSGRTSIELKKRSVRNSVWMSKAVQSELLATLTVDPTAERAVLQLTQAGKDLLEMV